jgi:peroxiredoxin Q/BCP
MHEECWHDVKVYLGGGRAMKTLEGKKAPDFVLEGSDGKKHSLTDYEGHTVILYFYPQDNTPGCTKEACAFRDMHKTLMAQGSIVMGISKDSLRSHEKFIADFKLPFVLLSDPDTKTMQEYRAWGEKKMYGKIVKGTIRSTVVIGPDGVILKHWPQVKNAADHPAEVLEFLENRDSV